MAQKPKHTEFLAEHGNPRRLTPMCNSKIKIQKLDLMKNEKWKTILNVIISVLTAIATTLGMSSCL